MQLATEFLAAPQAVPQRTAVFLHGILGSGGNLRGVARRFVAQFPHWRAALIDLRAHGRSLESDNRPDTIAQAAEDVAQTCAGMTPSVVAVIGHSLGGKVALAAANALNATHAMTLDSAPGNASPPGATEQVSSVLQWLDENPGPWPTRESFTDLVLASGLPGAGGMFAQWLAMNLEPRDGAMAWRLDEARIHSLFESHLRTDVWPAIQSFSGSVHLVVGTKSPAYGPLDKERAARAAQANPDRFTVDYLEAGHWVHADNPDGLHRVLSLRIGSS